MSFSIFRGGGGFALKVIKTPALSTSQKTYCVSLSRLQPSCWNVNPILRLPIKMQSTSEDAGSTASSSSSSYSSGSPDFLGPLKHHIKGQQSDQREEAAEVKKSKVVRLTVCCPHCKNKFIVVANAGSVTPSSSDDDHHHHTSSAPPLKRKNSPTSSNSAKKRRR